MSNATPHIPTGETGYHHAPQDICPRCKSNNIANEQPPQDGDLHVSCHDCGYQWAEPDGMVTLRQVEDGGFRLCWSTQHKDERNHTLHHELDVLVGDEILDCADAFGADLDRRRGQRELDSEAREFLETYLQEAQTQEGEPQVAAVDLPEPWKSQVLRSYH